MSDDNRDLAGISWFKGPNYHIWNFQLRALLLGKDLMDVVDRTEPKPPDTATAEEKLAWKKKDNLALSILN
jgi:hypothetical protein